MPEPQRNPNKASLLKMFVIDDDGNYSGEYTLDEGCGVKFGDVVKAVANAPMTEMQPIPLDEYKITAMHGGCINLIAISRGPLSSEELMWAKTALTATEDRFMEHGNPPSEGGGSKLISELEALRERIGNMESQINEERRKYEEEKEQLRQQLLSLSAPPPPSKAEIEIGDVRKRLLEDWKAVQARIAELVDHEERLQRTGQTGKVPPPRQEKLRTEIAALKI